MVRRTSTAELHSAADGVGRLTYFKSLLEENVVQQKTKLFLDSRKACHPFSKMKEPEEIKNEILLASIRKEFHSYSMETIR